MLAVLFGEEQATRLRAATREWAAHTIMCCIFLGGIYIVHKFSVLLWGEGKEPKLFNWLPLQYVFDAADLALIVTFLFYGAWTSFQIYRRGHK
jgi:hypothetical protein